MTSSETDSRPLSRRGFLRGMLGLLAAWGLRPSAAEAAAVSEAPALSAAATGATGAAPWSGEMPLAQMVNERLNFNISFWLFQRAGTVQLGLRPMSGRPGFYEAYMSGQTSGVIGFFTRYRKDTYRSAMQYSQGRLWPLEFQEEVIIGRDLRRRRTTTFNWPQRVVVRTQTDRHGKIVDSYQLAMPPGLIYDDYLSGLYNLRCGAFGPLREGHAYAFQVPKRKGGLIRVQMASPEENRRLLAHADRRDGRAFFSRILLDKDTLGSGSGQMQGWFSAQAVPVGGTMKDVVLFGDICGALMGRQVGG